MSNGDWEDAFPGLRSTSYRRTSPPDHRYNCIAWAAGDVQAWWEPDQFGRYAWPRGVRREYTLAAYMEAYAQVGYEQCDSAMYEADFEKIAIFVGSNGVPEHAARQLRNGLWTSKLGKHVDIEHELKALEGEQYGRVAVIMKRPQEYSREPAGA